MATPSLGRIVHYVDKDQHYAAMVIKIHQPPPDPPAPPSGASVGPPPAWIPTVDLHVFGHYMNKQGITYVTEVAEDPQAAVARTWHWPEKVAEK